ALTNLKAIESLFSDENGREFRAYDDEKRKKGRIMEARTYQAYIFGDDPEAGQAVDRDVKQRMEAKGVSYSDALRGRLREFRELLDYAEPINSPGVAIDAIAKDLQRRKKISYSEALRRAIAVNPTLGRNYMGVAAAYRVEEEDPTPKSIG